MKKYLIIFVLSLFIIHVSAEDLWKAWLQNVVNSNLTKSTVNGFKSIEFNDMFSWAWVFKIGIDLPEWIKKDNLDLSLNYNSYSTESFNPYGYAWNINLQPITRSSKKWVDTLYKSNEFFADWNELILVDSVNNIYKQKTSWSQAKYIFENWNWKVLDTSWNTYYYGNDELSKLDHPTDNSKVFAWYLTKKIDSRWNEVNYSYFKDNNQVYLQEINYVYLNSTSLYSVKFNYQDKKISSTSFRTQFEVKTSKLLSDIKIYVSDDLKKQYNFTYDAIDKPFSHLTKVELVSDNKVYQKYDFTYGTWKDMHLLTNIKTLNWLIVDFTYKPSVFYKEDGRNLNIKLPFNVKTLSNITYTDLISNNTLSEDYSYAWWYYYYNYAEIYGREYAWFNKVEKKDSLWKTEIYYFHQWQGSFDGSSLWEFQDDISKKWMLYRYELKDNSGSIFDTKITKWEKFSNLDWTYRVLPTREVESMKDGTTKATLHTYDNYWQEIEIKDLWIVTFLSQNWDYSDIVWDEKTVQKTYSINLEKNLFNFVSSQLILDKDNNLALKKEYFYDNLDLWNVAFWNNTKTKSYKDNSNFIEENNQYDNKWLLVKTINPRWHPTDIEYDQYWLFATKIINAKWFEENYTYDYITWKPISFIDINNVEYTYTYDILWRTISESVIDNWSKNLKSYIYDDTSIPNSIKETTYLNTEWTDSVINYNYLDSFWNPIQAKRKYKDKYVTSYMAYDSYGRKTYDYYKVFEDNLWFTTNYANLKWDKYTYDVLNRVTNINNANWDARYEYYDLWFTVYNQKDIPTTYNYDIDWNLIEVVESWDIRTKYSYNTLWKLIKLTDSYNNERSLKYDFLWRVLEQEDLHTYNDTDFWKRKYEYDNNWNIVKYTSMSWDNIIYTYDELNRLTSSIIESNWESINYSYDIWQNAKWLISSYTKWDYSESYNYDRYKNLISETKNYSTDSYTYNYTYNLGWLKLSIVYPDWKITNYTYEDWIEKWVNYNWTNLVNRVDYNAMLKVDNLEYQNNVVIKNTYDYPYNYRLAKRELISWWENYSILNYDFDNLSNISSIKESWNLIDFNKDVHYTYDDLNRLTEADYWSGELYSFSYNDIWNMISNSINWNYNYQDNGRNNPHAVSSISNNSWSINYNYDNNGNLIVDNNWTYNYNPKDELISFTNNSWSIVNYKYNSKWIRVEKRSSWSLDRYLNKDYEVEIRTTESGTITKISKYIFFNWRKIVKVETKDNNENLTYHYEDHLWWANIDLSSTWILLQAVDYLPYGWIRKEYSNWEYENKYKFTGKERDKESNLDYFEARYYDSENGRFRSIDRMFWEIWITKKWLELLWDPQQLNSYSYARDNPIIYIDIDWEQSVWIILGNDKDADGRYTISTEFNANGSAKSTWYVSVMYNHINKKLKAKWYNVDEPLEIITFEDFNKIINSGERDDIIVIAHWDEDGIALSEGNYINQSVLDKAEQDTQRTKTKLILMSCNTWNWESPIAQSLQNHYWFKSTIAPTWFVDLYKEYLDKAKKIFRRAIKIIEDKNNPNSIKEDKNKAWKTFLNN